MCRFLFHFELVKSFSEHAHDLALCDEGVGVDVVDHPVDVGCLPLPGHDNDEFYLMSCIIALRTIVLVRWGWSREIMSQISLYRSEMIRNCTDRRLELMT
mgnify:CR=1 FL=1